MKIRSNSRKFNRFQKMLPKKTVLVSMTIGIHRNMQFGVGGH